MDTNKIIIEKAGKDNADIAARLTLMAYKDFTYDIFGVDSDEEALEYYRKLWLFKNNRFS